MRRVHDETIHGGDIIFRQDEKYRYFSNEFIEIFSGMRGEETIRIAINSTILDGSIGRSTTADPEIRFMQDHFERALRNIWELFYNEDDNDKRGERPCNNRNSRTRRGEAGHRRRVEWG